MSARAKRVACALTLSLVAEEQAFTPVAAATDLLPSGFEIVRRQV
jgi:hypothetical protein